MILLVSLVYALLFALLLNKQIKKFGYIFYILSVFVCGGIAYIWGTRMHENLPMLVNKYAIGPFGRGSFATALFIRVMYIGVFTQKPKLAQMLFSIRGELSIIACIYTFAHNFFYGRYYFVNFFTHKIASVVSNCHHHHLDHDGNAHSAFHHLIPMCPSKNESVHMEKHTETGISIFHADLCTYHICLSSLLHHA